MVHAFIKAYKAPEDTFTECIKNYGWTGHGAVWQIMARAVELAARDRDYLNLPIDLRRRGHFQFEYLAAEGDEQSRATAKELFFDVDSFENIHAAIKKAEEGAVSRKHILSEVVSQIGLNVGFIH